MPMTIFVTIQLAPRPTGKSILAKITSVADMSASEMTQRADA